MSRPYYIKRGDTGPAISATLRDANGVIDLTNASGVRFLMARVPGRETVVSNDATIDDAAGGEVSYSWESGDTDEAGDYAAEFEVTMEDGTIMTFPNDGYIAVTVLQDVD